MTIRQLISAFLKVFNIIIVIILTGLAVYLSKNIFVEYAAKDTSFSQSEIPVTEQDSPTIVFGFWPLKETNYTEEVPYMAYEQFELGKDFEVCFGIEEGYNTIERINLTLNSDNLRLSHGNIGEVNFTKLVTKYGDNYKISANLINVKDPYMASLKINFNKNIPDEKLPDIEVSFSTESAAYGVTMWDWLDGDRISVTPVIGIQDVSIRPQKIVKLNNCEENNTFYKCFNKASQAQNYSRCPRKCSAVSTISNSIPVCKTTEEFVCAYEIAKEVKSSDLCLHQCSKTHYKLFKSVYTENTDSENAKRNVQINYVIPLKVMSIEKEYLINDFIGMLGSIGGTLGMFIGFSFLGVISSMLEYLQKFMDYLFVKKNNNKVIEVKEGTNNYEIIIEELIDECKRRVLEELKSQNSKQNLYQ